MTDFLTAYLQSLHGIPVLTHEDEWQLAKQISEGDEKAIEKLVTHNLRFVIFTIRKLASWNHSKVPQEDLIGTGNEGLLKAARNWQPTNGAKFATYAKPFIIRAVERGLDNTECLIRIPIKQKEKIRKMLYNERKLTNQLGRPPTTAELAAVLNIEPAAINQMRYWLQQEPTSLDMINAENLEDEHDD